MRAGDHFGEFTLVRLIGVGGQGAVFEAEDALGLRWALKISHRLAFEREVARIRFKNEAQWARGLWRNGPAHPGILVGDHYGILEDRFYVKMPLLSGRSLAQRLRRGPLPWKTALGVMRQVASALHAAHAAGGVHRDLKPENIFLLANGDVKVLDWGCVQLTEIGREGTTHQAGPLCTPGYAALEQYAMPRVTVTPAADVYSLGVIFYELLAGKHPFLPAPQTGAVHQLITEPTPIRSKSPTTQKQDADTVVDPIRPSVHSGQDTAAPPTGTGHELDALTPTTVMKLQRSAQPVRHKHIPARLWPTLQRMLAPAAEARPALREVVQLLDAMAAEGKRRTEPPRTRERPSLIARSWQLHPAALAFASFAAVAGPGLCVTTLSTQPVDVPVATQQQSLESETRVTPQASTTTPNAAPFGTTSQSAAHLPDPAAARASSNTPSPSGAPAPKTPSSATAPSSSNLPPSASADVGRGATSEAGPRTTGKLTFGRAPRATSQPMEAAPAWLRRAVAERSSDTPPPQQTAHAPRACSDAAARELQSKDAAPIAAEPLWVQ